MWGLCPFNSANHINGVGAAGRTNCYNPAGDLLPFQKALARKCATELNGFDNVTFEICNEPYWDSVSKTWEGLIADELAATEEALPNRHLIAQNVFNYEGVVTDPHPAVSIFNFHYALPSSVLANYGLNRPIGNDETGFAGQEDLPYRREAWEFALSGGSIVNHLDYSYTVEREDGIGAPNNPGGGGPGIRRQLGVLRWFLEGLPLAEMIPQTDFVTAGVPSGGAARALGAPGKCYALYLTGGTQANLTVNLPAGAYIGQWLDPRSGLVTQVIDEFTHAGGTMTLASPNYSEDVVLRLFAANQAPPLVAITSPVYHGIIGGPAASVQISAEASLADGTIDRVEFFDGDALLGVASTAPYTFTPANLGEGKHIFRARAVSSDGRTALSPPVNATVAGQFRVGVNLNGDTHVIDEAEFQSQAEAVASGLTISNAQNATALDGLTFYPTPDQPTGLMLKNFLVRTNATSNTQLGLTYPLSPGFYDVYLFVVEGQASHSRDMRVTLESQVVARGIGDIAKGEWHKYGPYRTQVTDGVLNIGLQQESKGVPKIAAFSIYDAAPPPASSDAWFNIEYTDGVVVLSYPRGLAAPKVETCDTLADAWRDLPLPASSLGGRDVVPVAPEQPRQFFRLRME
jgi:hypothetical protein